jgi:hypothetical protein
MSLTAYGSAPAATPGRTIAQLAALCLGLSLASLLLLAGGARFLPADASAGRSANLEPPRLLSVLVEFDVVVYGEELSELRSQEARVVPLRGAPAWVWQLPNDDARKIVAIEDWSVTAAADRQAGITVMEWTGRIIPEQEYWHGLNPRWLADPEWGGTRP